MSIIKRSNLSVEIESHEDPERTAKILAQLATMKPKRIIEVIQGQCITYYRVTPTRKVSKMYYCNKSVLIFSKGFCEFVKKLRYNPTNYPRERPQVAEVIYHLLPAGTRWTIHADSRQNEKIKGQDEGPDSSTVFVWLSHGHWLHIKTKANEHDS